jgi:hypothetical protein
MRLEGSCQCGKVSFSVESDTPVPFMYCFCSICRKLSGGPFGCNVMGKRATLKVTGRRWVTAYHARIRKAGRRTQISEGQRCFCRACGTHLYVLDDKWSEGVWPNVGAIDTQLPIAPEHVFMMIRYKPDWVPLDHLGPGPRYPEYPKLSIAAWHEERGLTGVDPSKKRRPSRKK